MSSKSELKRKLILEKAKELFVTKGYKNVTMKDVVEACDISRGGLYLYFDSTREIFLEVLKLENEETDEGFDEVISSANSVAEIISFFLKEQKKELLSKKDNLAIAKYEFLFDNHLPKNQNMIKKTFDGAVKVLASLIESGVESGEFVCENPKAAARNIMLTIEGLKISILTMHTDPKVIDEQLLHIMSSLMPYDEE